MDAVYAEFRANYGVVGHHQQTDHLDPISLSQFLAESVLLEAGNLFESSQHPLHEQIWAATFNEQR